jgi:hypothetical protein
MPLTGDCRSENLRSICVTSFSRVRVEPREIDQCKRGWFEFGWLGVGGFDLSTS